ncbi:MAG: ABC transporter permease [Gemmatimonadetes bacterium]|nr:ABC transporter permease [Gemmatimonadota bacterium]MDA1104345.1 ABC transporter permease [Gemmatimonadota bacterium]
MKRLNWFIARHYLRAGRGRGLLSLITWIALGGVTLGVAALITVISVMGGMQGELRGKILESTPHLYVLEYSTSLRLQDYRQVVDSILAMDDVVGAAPFAMSSVSVMRQGADYPQPAYLFGVDIDTTRIAATDMERSIIDGSLDLTTPASGLPPLLLGSVLADRMGVFPGDSLVVLSMENLKQDMFGGFQPTLRQFEVTGTFTTGMYEYDLQNVYTRLDAAQELIGIDSLDASGIGVRTADAERATEIGLRLGDRLGGPYYVESWITRNRALFSALELEKLALGVIVFLIVIVAAFNIVSTLVMVVSDRTKEIGILRTMGMTQAGILRVFVLQGVWIGVIGTAAGAALGIGLSWALDRFEFIKIPGDVYFVDHLPATLDLVDTSLVIVASIAISLVATIYPAVQASRLEPVDAIRHE